MSAGPKPTNGGRGPAGPSAETVPLAATKLPTAAWLVTEEARSVARGGVLFYPCAGADTEVAIAAFASDVSTFWFCDPSYRPGAVGCVGGCEATGPVLVQGEPNAAADTRVTAGRTHQWVEPCVWTASLRHRSTGANVTAHWRRGFGEYALAREFPDRSISVFMHRGDSPGEGGSGSRFLDRRPRRHEPLARLFDKLAAKLRDEALVVTDGSNCGIAPLKTFHNDTHVGKSQAFETLGARPFDKWGFRWRCIGYLDRRYGPTMIWRVTRMLAPDHAPKPGT